MYHWYRFFNGARLSCRRSWWDCVRIGSQEIPLVWPSTNGEKKRCRVVAMQTVVIPARSEFLIEGKLDEKMSLRWGTVGPVKEAN